MTPLSALPRNAFSVVTGTRSEQLVARLAADLSAEPLSPFATELVVVQSQGTERWLRNELAIRTGCVASTQFPFPAGFCRRLARSLSGTDIDERFTRDALTWRILELLEQGIVSGPAYAPIRTFAAGGDTRKRLGLAARIASTFDDYQLYRADVLLAWEHGIEDDANPHVVWQAALWRTLCDGEKPQHLARWFTEAIAMLESAAARPAGLPARVSVFGVSTLPPLFVALLRAAARFVPVRLYVNAPPHATWLDRAIPESPLYAAFGRTSRELLGLCADPSTTWIELPPDDVPRDGYLAELQRSVAGRRASGVGRRGPGVRSPLEAPAVAAPPTPDSGPPTLSLHSCHSPLRELEVLRDQLYAAFAADPTLRPHDVLVMVPDVPTYAPLVEAVFGVGEPELPHVPHRVADRAIAQESVLAGALLRMVRLVGARWTAAEVLELFDVPAVRRAAGISAQGAASVVSWVEETGIRWARDGAMRRDVFGLPAVESNSWRAGLDRLLMGYAVGPEESLVAGVLPHAGDTIGDPDTLGAFAHWVERLFETLDDWRTARPLSAWSRALGEAVSTFLAPGDEPEEQSLALLLADLRGLGTIERYVDADRAIDITVVRDWLEGLLGDDAKGTGFLTGGMTVCALKPMRAIPFRVVAVLGLDDASFPRSERRPAHDLIAFAPQAGDPDRRADDRQLFLDTILAARDRLILSWVGRSAKDNRERAVSVVVAELLDLLDDMFGRGTRDRVTYHHRLQPFSVDYYAAAPGNRLFSYSRVNARATAAAVGPRRPESPFVTARGGLAPPIAERPPLDVHLDDLVACYTNPARFFCEHALGLRLPGEDAMLDEVEPFEVDGLTKYGIRDRILQRHLAGERDRDAERLDAVARGELPPGALTRVWYDRIDAEIAGFLSRAELHRFEDPVAVRIDGEGWKLTGRVDGITGEGRTQLRPAKVRNRDLVRAWITHLALAAAFGEARSTVVGTDSTHTFGDLPDAPRLLATLVAGYEEALSAPLPYFEHASAAYVKQQHAWDRGSRSVRKTPIDAARDAFRGSAFARGPVDEHDAYVRLCWRGRDPFGDVSAFDRWSTALWAPLLDAEHASVPADAAE